MNAVDLLVELAREAPRSHAVSAVEALRPTRRAPISTAADFDRAIGTAQVTLDELRRVLAS